MASFASLRELTVRITVVKTSVGSMKFAAPTRSRNTIELTKPRIAGKCCVLRFHWSITIVTKSAVIRKSMPSKSKGMAAPITAPKTEPSTQISWHSSCTQNSTVGRSSSAGITSEVRSA